MVLEIAKYIPSEMRLDIAQDVIKTKGIRPLARELEVNPKSVYKYKKGSAHPGDEIMSKILAVARRDEDLSYDDYVQRLSDSFSQAMKEDIGAEEVIPSAEGEKGAGAEIESSSEGGTVGQQETEESVGQESSVDEKPTKKELSPEDISDRLGVSDPFEETKLRKTLSALTEEPQLRIDELVELTGLSRDAIERYLGLLNSENFVESVSEDTYTLNIELKEGE